MEVTTLRLHLVGRVFLEVPLLRRAFGDYRAVELVVVVGDFGEVQRKTL